MYIDLNRFLISLSNALDYVEGDFLGATSYHSQRVALITNEMMKSYGYDEETRYAGIVASILHDSALIEYARDEAGFLVNGNGSTMESNMKSHCIIGEEIAQKFPFYNRASNAVLYHHECADGSGAFGLRADETPLYAQLIHLSDLIDVKFNLKEYDDAKYNEILSFNSESQGTLFSKECVGLFKESINPSFLKSISGDIEKEQIESILKGNYVDIGMGSIQEMSQIFADITDYKSNFTWRHSTGVATKAYTMGEYYGYPIDESKKLYIAGLLHDIGKLLIPNSILEKPAKLDPDEYRMIQNHAIGTWNMLKDVKGLEDITSWASRHHEKLNGQGYPFGYTADELSKNDRLLACLDIYQALTEERPYKKGFSHLKAIEIMNQMGHEGQLDQGIIDDINTCFFKEESISDMKDDDSIKPVSGTAYQCPVCGYVYDGELPEDFICPRCEQPSSVFKKIS